MKEYKSSVERINLNENGSDDDCMKSLGEFIQNSQTIDISVGNNNITDKGIEILLPYLIGNTTIKKFNIYENKGITDKSVPLLKETIYKSNIENINIWKTLITKEGRNEIKASLSMPIDKREMPLITKGDVKSASKIVNE